MSEWISVSDRLPGQNTLVVAAKLYEYIDDPDACLCNFFQGAFHVNTDGLEASNYDGGAAITMNFEPTHWLLVMPPRIFKCPL
jgi:hypothetical protein